jgi:hypothetical protein
MMIRAHDWLLSAEGNAKAIETPSSYQDLGAELQAGPLVRVVAVAISAQHLAD